MLGTTNIKLLVQNNITFGIFVYCKSIRRIWEALKTYNCNSFLKFHIINILLLLLATDPIRFAVAFSLILHVCKPPNCYRLFNLSCLLRISTQPKSNFKAFFFSRNRLLC